MAFDEELAGRVRSQQAGQKGLAEKKMFVSPRDCEGKHRSRIPLFHASLPLWAFTFA